MSFNELYLGIDTSCYTTSVSAELDGELISLKKPLEVKVGQCGLRQSEAFFQHVKNLPIIFDELKGKINFRACKKVVVAVSSRPRNIENSYMPVFSAGQSFAKTIASVCDSEYFEVSHQEGHIMAAIHSVGDYSLMDEPLLTYHISGGTTELLLAVPENGEFRCEIVGGTKDLPAGQFIDRIGVKCGFEFPCGRFVDRWANEFQGEKPKVKICVKDGYINFSGEETRYQRILEENGDASYASYCTMKCIADSIKKSIIQAREKYNIKNVLMVGGVSSSQFMRKELSDLENVYFARQDLCTDNAVGVCLLGKLRRSKQEGGIICGL